MTARPTQPTAARRGRCIVERPRLIKLLDEAEQQTILLLAPAGYGKTTLERQWAKMLTRAIWIGLTSAHRDVVTLAEDLARGIDSHGGNAARFVDEYLRAHSNPQRVHRELGAAVAARLDAAKIQWLIFDDYQSIMTSTEAEEFVLSVRKRSSVRLLIASRARPTWASGKSLVYGENAEIHREQLAMDAAESAKLLRNREVSESFARHAQGWPAVLALAAAADMLAPPEDAPTVPADLHRYLAEELFQAATPELQAALLTLALLGRMPPPALERHVGPDLDGLIEQARTLGFDSGDEEFELHPLIREFLLQKLLSERDRDAQVRRAIEASLQEESWDNALELVLRFKLLDLVEPVLERAFKPLIRAGRLATLSTFATEVWPGPTFPPPAIEAAQAEIAFHEGQLELARDLTRRVLRTLPTRHPLRSRAASVLGYAANFFADYSEAEAAFMVARDSAEDERDAAEALHGLAIVNVLGERTGAAAAVSALGKRRNISPTDLVRYTNARILFRRLHDPKGFRGELHLDAVWLALSHVEDPRARTSLTQTVAGALAQRADYEVAKKWLKRFFEDAATFDLEFAMPYANWTAAQIALGLRRFGEAERLLQAVEDFAHRSGQIHHEVNARSLRARLLLESGKTEAAVSCVSTEIDDPVIPSWRGEYYATRSLALACAGDARAAAEAATTAKRASIAHDVQLFVAAAGAISSGGEPLAPALALLESAKALEIWDPVVCALRSSRDLADVLAHDSSGRRILERLYRRINDRPLARRAGFRTRAAGSPSELLSPREMEILGLIARGYTNIDIANALYIAPSTAKSHIHHILEKLGVRTRAQAVARLEGFS
jgi:LuxR family maltose regulon positive regulatory protein